MADQKITELNEMTAHEGADELAIVNDTGGTPETQKITRANLLTPQYFYAPKTSQQAMTTSFSTVTAWAAAEQEDAAFSWNNTTGILTINTTGLYRLTFQIMFNLQTGTRMHAFAQLQVDPLGVGSYALESGMQIAGYGRTVDEGTSGMCQKIISLNSTDLVRIQALEVGGSLEINGPAYPGTYLMAELIA